MSVTLDDIGVDGDALSRDVVSDATIRDVGVHDGVTRDVAATLTIQDGDAALVLSIHGVDFVAAEAIGNVGDDDDVVFRRRRILSISSRYRWRPFGGA